MTQTEAAQVLRNAGFTDGEVSKIMHAAIRSGSALTVPRKCPSLFIDVYYGAWRVMENDTGIIYNLATTFPHVCCEDELPLTPEELLGQE